MKFTNKLDLPQPIVDAVMADPYSKGASDFSVTELIKPAYQCRLIRDHYDEITVDVSERFFSLLGQLTHLVLERTQHTAADYITEKRYFAKIDGCTISGQADVFFPKPGLLQDYKLTSVWKIVHQGYDDWIAQLNMLRRLMAHNGLKVERQQIVALLRDRDKKKAKLERSYPQQDMVVVDMPLWTEDSLTAYMSARVMFHREARDAKELAEVPPCTPEECWATETTWAIKKKGATRAINGGVFPTQEAAEEKLKEVGASSHVVEYRPGFRRRCADYCDGSEFCPHWARIKQENAGSF